MPEQRRIYEGALGGPFIHGETTSVSGHPRSPGRGSAEHRVRCTGWQARSCASVPRRVRGEELSGSITHKVGATHTLSVRVTGEVQSVDHDGIGGTTLPDAGWNQHADETQLIVGDRWIASRNVLHEWRFLVGHETRAR